MNNNYNNMSDDELLKLINKKDTDALDFLICKYADGSGALFNGF